MPCTVSDSLPGIVLSWRHHEGVTSAQLEPLADPRGARSLWHSHAFGINRTFNVSDTRSQVDSTESHWPATPTIAWKPRRHLSTNFSLQPPTFWILLNRDIDDISDMADSVVWGASWSSLHPSASSQGLFVCLHAGKACEENTWRRISSPQCFGVGAPQRRASQLGTAPTTSCAWTCHKKGGGQKGSKGEQSKPQRKRLCRQLVFGPEGASMEVLGNLPC